MEYDHAYISKLSERFKSKIMSELEDVIFNGDPETNYPGCVNLSFAYVEGESLLMAMKDVALSSGSACTSASLEPSYVLRAIGADEELAHSSIRFGIGRFTTQEEVEKFVNNLKTLKNDKLNYPNGPMWIHTLNKNEQSSDSTVETASPELTTEPEHSLPYWIFEKVDGG